MSQNATLPTRAFSGSWQKADFPEAAFGTEWPHNSSGLRAIPAYIAGPTFGEIDFRKESAGTACLNAPVASNAHRAFEYPEDGSKQITLYRQETAGFKWVYNFRHSGRPKN
jgi:hypothetical protein